MGRWMLVLLLSAGLTVSCNRERRDAVQPAGGSTNRQTFEVKGVVQSVKPRQKEVEIKHEAIPGYMPAMTMPFEVKDTNELTGLEPGQAVSFRLIVTDTDGWIEQVRKLSPAATNGAPTPTPFRQVRDVQPLNSGDLLPEYHFTNQFGGAFSTADYKGRALAITFLFTRCPYPTFCPRMAGNFEEAQRKMLAMANAPTNWHLLTISFDPEFDRPEILKAYAQGHHYDPAHWTFATGALIDITAIGEQFGLAFWRDQTGSISHNLRTVIVDATGRVQTIYQGNNWTSDELAADLVKGAGAR
jgi:protein SCO1